MPELVHIDPSQLDYIWPFVAEELARAVVTNKGEEDMGQVRMKVLSGHYQLLVYSDNEQIKTVVVNEFLSFPNVRIAHVAYLAKSLTPDGHDLFTQWAVANGASQIQAFCGDAQARLFKRFGFADAYHVMRLSL